MIKDSGKAKTIFLILGIALLLCSMVACSAAEETKTLKLSADTVTIAVKKSVKITAAIEGLSKNEKPVYQWSSSDESVATVRNGMISGVGAGDAVITCMAVLKDGMQLSAQASVSVVVPVTSLKLSTAQVTVPCGSATKIEYTVLPENASNKKVNWLSQDETVAVVDEEGVLTAKSAGSTVIEGVTADSSNRKAKLSVYVPSLKADTDRIVISSEDPVTFTFRYFGSSPEDLQYQCKPGVFESSVQQFADDPTVFKVQCKPVSAGTNQFVVTDKKDRKSKLMVEVEVEENIYPANTKIRIDSVNVALKGHNTSIQINFTNLSSDDIRSFDYLLDYYDVDGYQRIILVEALNTQLLGYNVYTINKTIKSGQSTSGKILQTWNDYQISRVRVAVLGYTFKNGTKVMIPDSQLYWFDSTSGYEKRPNNGPDYQIPSQEVFDKADKFMIGYNALSVYSYVMKKYLNISEPGDEVVIVNKGSLAIQAGLRVEDIIYGVDELLWKDEPCCIDIAKARLFDGETVTLHVLRNGEKLDLVLKR